MPIYDFNQDLTVKKEQTQAMHIPHGLREMPSARQISHSEGRKPLDGQSLQAYPYHLEEFLATGFWSLDAAMRKYWSGIRVPTKDSYRFMRVKVAGGDKSVLTWADELNEGRIRLPVAALDRTKHEFNAEKFSPAYHSMTARYLNARGDTAARVYRPVPYLVSYTMIVWANRKRDIEYIMYQVMTRFNPLAEFRMFDGKIAGAVQLRFNGVSDASDKEVGHDERAKVRYEVDMQAEAWLPLPEKIVPTILGRVNILREIGGDILAAAKGSGAVDGYGADRWYQPTTSVTEAQELVDGTS